MNRFGATIPDGDGLRLTADEVALFWDVNPLVSSFSPVI